MRGVAGVAGGDCGRGGFGAGSEDGGEARLGALRFRGAKRALAADGAEIPRVWASEGGLVSLPVLNWALGARWGLEMGQGIAARLASPPVGGARSAPSFGRDVPGGLGRGPLHRWRGREWGASLHRLDRARRKRLRAGVCAGWSWDWRFGLVRRVESTGPRHLGVDFRGHPLDLGRVGRAGGKRGRCLEGRHFVKLGDSG